MQLGSASGKFSFTAAVHWWAQFAWGSANFVGTAELCSISLAMLGKSSV